MPLQWRNQFWQSLAEGAGKRCSECGVAHQYHVANTVRGEVGGGGAYDLDEDRVELPHSEHRFPASSSKLCQI